MRYTYPFLFYIFLLISCTKKNILKPIEVSNSNVFTKHLTEVDLKNWHEKDVLLDSVPGISLNRAYDSILSSYEKGNEIIVAILDTEIDINHEDLKNRIWLNTNEVPDNGIDDDNNGYIDDINGWNFIGNLKRYNIMYSNLESVRIIQKFSEEFNNKTIEDIEANRKADYLLFKKAKNFFEEKLKQKKSDQEYGNFLFYGYPKAKKTVKEIFNHENYTIKQLDSLYTKLKNENSPLASDVYFISDFIKYDLTEEWIKNYKTGVDSSIAKTYNLSYFDKIYIDSKPNDVNFKSYGNPLVNNNIDEFYHGTLIAGLIAANRNNKIGISGISENVKIMPVAISSNGSEHDKDIALGIRYAVENGAKVINMSFGKDFSLNMYWVFDAIKYAEENDVLIISSAGNSNYNLNEYDNYFPIDNKGGNEVSDNFLLVGSTSSRLDSLMFSNYSNYGNLDVDVFAPGEKIYTTMPNDQYRFDSGTSLSSAITSGIAALIRSYYPKLTASQVKHILMDSGVEYTFDVKVGDTMLPFNSLSKSGKIVNAYNALIMADSISRIN